MASDQSTDLPTFARLVEWARGHGAVLHPSIEIYRDATTGYSFRVASSAEDGLHPGDIVVTCPMNITLSYLNALDSPQGCFHRDATPGFPQVFLDELPPYVVGRFFLIKQYLLGEESFWWPYIRTLPQPDQLSSWILPPLWPADDQELLEGTNLEVTINEVKSRLKKEYKQAVKLLEGMGNAASYTRLLYNWAYCIYTSRSFAPKLVIPEADKLELPSGRSINDFSLLLPLMDVGNHSIVSAYAWDITSERDSCRFLTQDSFGPGQQVFNNYGMKTNGALLMAYGFLIPESSKIHNDYIHFRRKAVEGNTEDVERTVEWYVSLRPMHDPSSVVGRSVQTTPANPGSMHPAFTHVQDGLVWDIVRLQTTPEQRREILPVDESLDPDRRDHEQLHQMLSGRIAPEARPLLEQTVAIIYNKVLQELERLDETEFEVETEGLSRNQQTALQYRRQCRKVLENVLESITEDIPPDDD
jgi:protein-histidine N-methyltransferase